MALIVLLIIGYILIQIFWPIVLRIADEKIKEHIEQKKKEEQL